MKFTCLPILVLAMILAGCASLSSERYVTVETTLSNGDGLNSVMLKGVFHAVAGSLGLKENESVSSPRNPDEFEYSAVTDESDQTDGTNTVSKIRVVLKGDRNHTEIIATIYGKKEDAESMDGAVDLIEHAFDALGIKYKIRRG